MSDAEPVLEVLRRYFPNEGMLRIRSADLFYGELNLTQDPDMHGINHAEQRQHLRNLERGLRLASKAMTSLHWPVRHKIEEVHKANVLARKSLAPRFVTVDRLEGKHPTSVVVQAADLLNRLHAGLLGEWTMYGEVPQDNALKIAKDFMAQLSFESRQASRSKTWKKIIFVEKARQVWREFGAPEPPTGGLNEGSPFAKFLGDLIEAIGEDWDEVSTFKAWMRAKKSGQLSHNK